jgi:hypothetical protein
MRIQAKIFGILVLALAAAACGDDDGGNGGSGGTGGTGGTGGQTSTVTGEVVTRGYVDFGTPVSGATVGVFETSLSTTSGASGEFTLENVPNGDVFFTTTASGHWGIVDYYVVPFETGGGAELGVVPDEEFTLLETELDRTINESDGAVVIVFEEGAVGGETGTISVGSDDPFTFDLDGNPVEQAQIIADDEGYGELFFTGVDPAEGPITATVTGAAGSTTCEVDESLGTRYPIFAKSVTIVYAFCEAL